MDRPGGIVILLIDMDSFFASVEQAHHPFLKGRPVIVCGDPGRRGVVTAASYEARPYGVKAGMPLGQAKRLCPHAAYVEGNPDKYVAVSLQLLELYRRYSPELEPFSVDEAFVGLDRNLTLDEAARVAREIQRGIEERFQLGASIGVGPNKLIAKMASGVSKPRGLTALDEGGYRSCFWPRDVQELWGVGPKLAVRMRSLGIRIVGELAHVPMPILKGAFGIIGPQLREAAWGRDDTPLVPYYQGVDAKSMGHEVTLTEDSMDRDFLLGTMLRLSDQVARRMRTEGYLGSVVALKLRNQRFETVIRQRSLSNFTNDHVRIFEIVRSIWASLWNGEPVRLLGVSVSGLARSVPGSEGELFDAHLRSSALRSALDEVRDRLGEASIVPAGSLSYRRSLRHVPFGAAQARSGSHASRPGTEA